MTRNSLVTLKRAVVPEARLIWLPHAGGSATFFQELSNALPVVIECLAAEYPGRGRRIREPASTALMHMADDIAGSIALLPKDLPIILFGHSMGARVGFEVCRKLRAMRPRVFPKLLIASACEPLHVERVLPFFHEMPDDQLLDALMSMNESASRGGIEEEFLRASLRSIRSDLAVGETHKFIPFPVPDQNLLIYGGTRDRVVRGSVLSDWRRLSTGTTRFKNFEGGHFYMLERPTEFLLRLYQDISYAIGKIIPTFNLTSMSETDLSLE